MTLTATTKPTVAGSQMRLFRRVKSVRIIMAILATVICVQFSFLTQLDYIDYLFQWRGGPEKTNRLFGNHDESEEVETYSSIPLTCRNETGIRDGYLREYCCASWDVAGDDWWLHHPDWEVSLENDTHYCFSPIENEERANFLRELHTFQWDDSNCSNIEMSTEINSGFGAGSTWLAAGLRHAYLKSKKPFQIINNYRRWLYSTDDNSSWAYCSTEDSRCYYLDINPCNRTIWDVYEVHSDFRLGGGEPIEEKFQYHWMYQYIFRRRQNFRYQLYKFRKDNQLDNVVAPCVTMHVRRGDAAMMFHPFRRYAAVQEYIDAANITLGETIFLLTDDESTVDEVRKYHANKYNWIYVDRPRTTQINTGFNGHIPSDDPAYELIVLDTELTVGSRCDKVVRGNSAFMRNMLLSMTLENKHYVDYYVNTDVSEQDVYNFSSHEERAKSLFHTIDMYNQRINSSLPENSTETL
jgi:hypothetical protein